MKARLLLAAALVSSFGALAEETTNTLALGEFLHDDNSNYDEMTYDGFNYQNSPVLWAYKHSGVQTFYLPEELEEMKGKEITSISFKWYSEDWYTYGYTSEMNLYLQEVDDTAFSYDEDVELYQWFPFDEKDVAATMDFEADFQTAAAYGEDGLVTFNLSAKPYVYTGRTLLLTVTNDMLGIETSDEIAETPSGIRFYWIPNVKEQANRSLGFGSDQIDFLENQSKNLYVKSEENEFFQKEAPAVEFSYRTASSGVSEMMVPGNLVSGGSNRISVVLADAADVNICNVSGQVIVSESLERGNHDFQLAAGLYIVKAGETVAKVFVY